MAEPNISLPERAVVKETDTNTYRERLAQARVKTDEDLTKMNDEDIKKLYLKHEQSVVDDMSDQMCSLFAQGYTNLVSKFLPIKGESDLETHLTKDAFLKSAVKELLIPVYYKWGAYLAPVSVAATTAAHIDYNNFINKSQDDYQKESQKGDSST